MPKTVQTVVDLVPPPSHTSHESLPLGPIIGGVAGGLVGLVIIVWLISIPLRRMSQARESPTIDWQTFPPHHSTRHGVGEGEDDDDEHPMNSALAVLGPAALTTQRSSTNTREGNPHHPSLQRQQQYQGQDDEFFDGFEMTDHSHYGSSATGNGGIGSSYGIDGLYPYSHLDGGFDPEHAAWYQERSVNSQTPTSPTQTHQQAGSCDIYRHHSPHPEPPPPWQPNEAFLEVPKSPPITSMCPLGQSPPLNATCVQQPDQPSALAASVHGGGTPVLQTSARDKNLPATASAPGEVVGSMSSYTLVGSAVGSQRSKSNVSSVSHNSSSPPSAAPSAHNSPEQVPIVRMGNLTNTPSSPPPIPIDFPAHRIYHESLGQQSTASLAEARCLTPRAGSIKGSEPAVLNSPALSQQQFHRPNFALSTKSMMNRESVLPLPMERFGALRITNAISSDEEQM